LARSRVVFPADVLEELAQRKNEFRGLGKKGYRLAAVPFRAALPTGKLTDRGLDGERAGPRTTHAGQ